MRRLTSAIAIVGAVVAAAFIAWGIGRGSVTPQEAAPAPPPERSILSVPVERRRLETTVVSRATVGPAGVMPVDLSGSFPGRGVVTVAPDVGERVAEGDVALEIDGRPVIILEGTRPAYRVLGPGTNGPDVIQLQDALDRLGFGVGDVDGVFGPSTESAVIELYVSVGYEPPLDGDLSSSRGQRLVELWSQFDEESCVGRGCPAFDELVDIYEASGLDPLVPLPQISFVAELPRLVAIGSPQVGDAAEASDLILASTRATAEAVVSSVDAQLVSVGDGVMLDEEVSGLEATGSVVDIATNDAETAGLGTSALIVIELDDGEDLIGRSVRVRIPVEETDGEVIAVPIAALRSDASDRVWIDLVDDDGSLSPIEVRPGLRAGGLVEVEPLEGEIPTDAWVVIGEEDSP